MHDLAERLAKDPTCESLSVRGYDLQVSRLDADGKLLAFFGLHDDDQRKLTYNPPLTLP